MHTNQSRVAYLTWTISTSLLSNEDEILTLKIMEKQL